ncbi:2,3-bisphosphoglycerate-independent phosphoglycerate mutase [Halocalculus aciditolerans]|uniref:2,3-bisphosphoglycerate-independent phosphoglycerate mutase n=1 Tax=Halocalculus aciditolerans TaxID=1383812 RepID=A0A830FFB9_9EURY|nr:2,3-bisphosphoglycerate-independent phosphoglycerate mutase [Halocalculus aciditolerans]GGL49764.1 2,3-bisphosphoglycerate-independent phosphoglycerate mutase [Halocalculus aciditolerans]
MKSALVILDGWGLGDDDPRRADPPTNPARGRNAVTAAETPNFERYADAGAFGQLRTSGRDVGLPRGQMGNSEVGHLTLGAGRVVNQEYTRIEDAIADDELRENPAVRGAFDYAAERGGRVHFMGLVSDGGVHSDHEHLHALIEAAADYGVPASTHAFTDGRDTSPTGGEDYLYALEEVVENYDTGDVATVCGRYYAMDRDQNWERTKQAYDAIVKRNGLHRAESAHEAVRESYERGETDEFVEPTIVRGGDRLSDGDSVVFFNFRADRARQLVRMLADIDPEWSFETTPPDVAVTTMTSYDETFDLPVAFPPREPKHVTGAVLADAGLTQLRLAESEKYAHVTYFFNGGRETEFDGEIRRIVDSPDVETYDEQPAMSAREVTDTAIDVVESEDPDFVVLNYANADMVGHTGDFDAAVDAVEAVDEQLGRLLPALADAGANTVVTADHGNADDMGTPEDPHTAHTLNPVPCVYLAPDGTGDGKRIRDDRALRDVAPTLLDLADVDVPAEMTGESLLR